jgi:hypothetical protein
MQLDLGNSLTTTLYAFVYIVVIGVVIELMSPSKKNCSKYEETDKISCMIENLKNSRRLKREQGTYYIVLGVLSLMLGYYVFYELQQLQVGMAIITGGTFLLLIGGVLSSDSGDMSNPNMMYILLGLLVMFMALGGVLFFQVLGMNQYKLSN